MNNNRGLTTGKKAVILTMMSTIAVFLLVIACILLFKVDDSRTIMIYMSGTNLEDKLGLASYDLAGIIPDKVDLEKNNVILYAGGTKKWHNTYIQSGENSIFQLTKDGFVKIQTYDMASMGNVNSLTTFLNYGYDNYKTGKYDLIIWDHGAGALGSMQDDFYENDMLTLAEFDEAFKNSRFNSKNKLETIIFRTCLNATFEVATVLSPYAEYMVASEEITRGATNLNVLGFINNIKSEDGKDRVLNGKEYGELFIDAYKDQMDVLNEDAESVYDSTYSIIDLTKISGLMDKMNMFFSKIDVNKNYKDLARIRSTMHQYGKDSAGIGEYDTVDLYELVDYLKLYSTGEAESIMTYLKNNVIQYNWSTNTHSNGLSIYFPYYGSSVSRDNHFYIYDNITTSYDYKNFITAFNKNQQNPVNKYSFSFADKEIVKDKKEFKIKLTEEEQENYSKAGYMIFIKEADGYFTPIYSAEDAELDKDGYLSTDITDSIIRVVDDATNETDYFTALKVETVGKGKEYTTPVLLYYINLDGYFDGSGTGEQRIDNGNAHFIVDDDKVSLDKVYIIDKESDEDAGSASSASVDIDSYTSIMFPRYRYKILDENGNYTPNWESNPTKYLVEVQKDKYHFETVSLDDGGEYYCVFAIFDSQNNVYYSNLISIN